MQSLGGTLPAMKVICESCGRDDDALTTVRRVWVTPEQWDTQGRLDLGELESWCSVCMTHYPHQVDEPPAN